MRYVFNIHKSIVFTDDFFMINPRLVGILLLFVAITTDPLIESLIFYIIQSEGFITVHFINYISFPHMFSFKICLQKCIIVTIF